MLEPPDDVANAPALLAEGRALRALAQSLLGPGDADDVVQESYATALAAPAVARRRLGPWLSGTVRNLAAMVRRSDTRRRARERLVAREELDAGSDPAVIAAQAEVIHAVAAAVRALDEPFRTVIVLRFWHGMLPEAIAQQLGVPRNTVRSRLQRGLERLRARLDGLHGGRERWSAPLLAVAGVEKTAAASGAATGVGFLLGVGLLMKTKLLVAVAAVLIAALSISWLMNETPASTSVAAAMQDPARQPIASLIEQPPAVVIEPTRVAVPAPTSASQPADVPPDSSPVRLTPWFARFLVVDEDERPVADAVITISATRVRGPLLELHTDPEGRASTTFELEVLWAFATKNGARTGERLLVPPSDILEETKFVLEVPTMLRGLVVRTDGSPAPGAEVEAQVGGGPGLHRGQAPQPAPVIVGPDGRFEFPVLRQHSYVLHATSNGAMTFRERRFVLDDHPREVVLSFPGAITINGVVVDPDAKPIDKATVTIWREFDPADPDAKEPFGGYEQSRATCDTDGRFSIAVRKHARYQILAAAAGHATSDLLWVQPTAARPHAEVRLEMRRFTTIRGVVQHANGSPFGGVTVRAKLDDPNPTPAMPSLIDRYQQVDPAVSRPDGSFELRVHTGTPWSIVAQPVAENPWLLCATKGVVPGRDDVVIVISDEELAGCVVAGRVVLAAGGRPLQDFEVAIVSYDDQGKPRGTSVVAPRLDGNRFELQPLPLGRTIALQVTPKEPGQPLKIHGLYAPTRVAPFVTSRVGIDVQVRIDAWGELPVQVLAADGKPPRRIRVSAIRDVYVGASTSARPVDAEGRIVLKQCAPGPHKLNVWNDHELLLDPPVTILPGLNPEMIVRLPPASAPGKSR